VTALDDAREAPLAEVETAIRAVWGIESARLIAGLVRRVLDLDLAEEFAQEALLAALDLDAALDDEVGDDLLCLVFTACHPCSRPKHAWRSRCACSRARGCDASKGAVAIDGPGSGKFLGRSPCSGSFPGGGFACRGALRTHRFERTHRALPRALASRRGVRVPRQSAMFALADVLDFLVDKLGRSSRRRFALCLCLACALHGSCFRHARSPIYLWCRLAAEPKA
jgi:hypothetical protein